jgi:hypothetical protein
VPSVLPDSQHTLEAGSATILRGGKHLKSLERHLRHLRSKYVHGNRVLFYDDVVCAYLLAFFNPTLKSLRTLEDMSRLPAGQAHLKVRRLCRSTVSDANALFDATLLEPLIADLRRRVPDLKHRDTELSRLLEQVQVVDGSFFAAAADIAFAIRRKGSKKGAGRHKVRLDLHLDGHLLPRHLIISGKGCSESASAQQQIDPQAIYIVDRGYNNFKYVSLLLSKSADVVLRLKEPVNFAAREKQILDESDRAAGVISDSIGTLTGSPHSWRDLPEQQLREVLILDPRHPDKPIRLLTSLMDPPAHVIGALYKWRWQIELFFRWLKVHANFRHLISHSKNGMTLGFYVAVIAVLLIYLHTGRPMSKYAYNLLSLCANGWGTIDDVLVILEARERECERDRQRQQRRRNQKTGL